MLLERLTRRALDHLAPYEGLLASAAGREAGGRRRVGIVATDRRVLLVTLRPEPPERFDYDRLEIDARLGTGPRGPSVTEARVELRTPDRRAAVDRLHDLRAARILVDLVERRLTDRPGHDRDVPRVRIVS